MATVPTIYHKDLAPASRHAVTAWEFATEAERLLQPVTSGDINKLASQGSGVNSLLFRAVAVGQGASVWAPVAGTSSGGTTPSEVTALINAQKDVVGGVAAYDTVQTALAGKASTDQAAAAATAAVNSQKGVSGGIAAYDATQTALSGKANTSDIPNAVSAAISAQKGVANGLASLGSDGRVLPAQLPASTGLDATGVRAVPLTGLSTSSSSAITATDTILSAAGKTQAQLNLKINTSDVSAAVTTGINAQKGVANGIATYESVVLAQQTADAKTSVQDATAAANSAINAQKNIANGIVGLNSSATVPSAQLGPLGLLTQGQILSYQRSFEPPSYAMQMIACNTPAATVPVPYGTYAYQFPAEGDFSGLRLVLKNFGEAYTVDKIGVAGLPTATNNGSSVTWVQCFYQGNASFTVPGGTGTGIARQPGILVLDWVDMAPVPRTDGGLFPLIQARVVGTNIAINTTTNGDQLNDSKLALTDQGYLFARAVASGVDSLAFPTSPSINMAANSHYQFIGHVEFRSQTPGQYTLFASGDSLTAGYSGNATQRQAGMLNLTQAYIRNSGAVGGIANYAIGATNQDQFYGYLRLVTAQTKPRAVYIAGYTPNGNPTTVADYNVQLAACKVELDFYTSQGIKVYVANAMPKSGLDGSTARNIANRNLAQVVNQYGGQVVLVDVAGATENPFNKQQYWPQFSYDTLHDNMWSYRNRAIVFANLLGLSKVDQQIRLTPVGSKITIGDNPSFGRGYAATTGAVATVDRAGNADKRLPRGSTGTVRAYMPAILDVANVQWIFGLNTVPGNPVYNTGADGMKYGVAVTSTGDYQVIIDGTAPVAPNGTAAAQVAGDSIFFSIGANDVVLAYIQRITSNSIGNPILLHTFAAPRTADLFPAMAVTYSGGTTVQQFGPIVGTSSFV